jgi:folate-dependent phosphoribosylglycinamide formyltransferase PurN
VALLDRDSRRGVEYDVVCCLSSGEAVPEARDVERHGIPCIPHSIRAFCRERGSVLTDLDARADYDAATLELLWPFRPDLILLDGYLLLLTHVFLEAYANRTVNIHHGDLHIRMAGGQPKYTGLRAVRDALLAGEIQTRASVHIVTARLDDGPVIVRSWPFRVPAVARWAWQHEAPDVLRACAWAHQEWMLRTAWEPLMARIIGLACQARRTSGGRLDLRTAGEWELTEGGTLVPAELMAAG